MRWKMCPKCHIKLVLKVCEKDLVIYRCLLCKCIYLTVSGSLSAAITEMSKNLNLTPTEYLLSCFNRIIAVDEKIQ